MTRCPRTLRILAGVLLPLASGAGLAAQERPAVVPDGPPPAFPAPPAGPEVPGTRPACPPAGINQGPAEGRAAPGVGWWGRLKYRLQACFLGFPEEFEAPPLGASVYAFGRAQVANAEAAQMVLYQADFVEGSCALTPRGREQLAKIALLLSRNFCPLIIEQSLCAPDLDQARLTAVVNELGHCGFAIPPQRVVIGRPPAIGLDGVQAGLLYNNLLGQTLSGGVRGGGGGGPVGGGGGPGLGGPPGGAGR